MNHLSNMPCDIFDTIYKLKDDMEIRNISLARNIVRKAMKNLRSIKDDITNTSARISENETYKKMMLDHLNHHLQTYMTLAMPSLSMRSTMMTHDRAIVTLEEKFTKLYIKMFQSEKNFDDALDNYRAAILLKAKGAHNASVYDNGLSAFTAANRNYLFYKFNAKLVIYGAKVDVSDIDDGFNGLWQGLSQDDMTIWNNSVLY